MKEWFELSDKVAIVTGGYSHLGASFTRALLRAGAYVVVAGRSEEKYLACEFDKLKSRFIYLDILDAVTRKQLFQRVEKEFGGIDILVNSAVTLEGQNPEAITDAQVSFSIEGVLGATYRMIRDVIPYMRKRGGGNIVNVTSMYGVVVPDFRMYEGEECAFQFNPPLYGACKAGVIQLTKYFAEYLAKDSIRVNAICPGTFPSDATQRKSKEFVRRLTHRVPWGRIGTPEDLEGVLLFLVSEASRYVVGQNIQVDGGWTLW